MAKILVVYDSRSGNTEKMASAIADGAREVKSVNAIAKKASQTSLEDLIGADGIIMGSPTYYGLMSGKLKTLIDKSVKIHGKLDGKVGAAFTSSGGVASGAETTLLSIVQAMLVHGMIVQGRSEDKHYGAAAVGIPKEKDLASCRDLGKRVARLVMKLKIEPCTAFKKPFVIAHLNSRFINLINTSKPKDQQWSISTPNETSDILLRDRFCSHRMCNTDRLVPDVHDNCFK